MFSRGGGLSSGPLEESFIQVPKQHNSNPGGFSSSPGFGALK